MWDINMFILMKYHRIYYIDHGLPICRPRSWATSNLPRSISAQHRGVWVWAHGGFSARFKLDTSTWKYTCQQLCIYMTYIFHLHVHMLIYNLYIYRCISMYMYIYTYIYLIHLHLNHLNWTYTSCIYIYLLHSHTLFLYVPYIYVYTWSKEV